MGHENGDNEQNPGPVDAYWWAGDVQENQSNSGER